VALSELPRLVDSGMLLLMLFSSTPVMTFSCTPMVSSPSTSCSCIADILLSTLVIKLSCCISLACFFYVVVTSSTLGLSVFVVYSSVWSLSAPPMLYCMKWILCLCFFPIIKVVLCVTVYPKSACVVLVVFISIALSFGPRMSLALKMSHLTTGQTCNKLQSLYFKIPLVLGLHKLEN